MYYYSTQPFLAWCLNFYVYKKHFAYIATPFYPYRLPNPKSSNPYLIYQDLYSPWKDKDDSDKYINRMRLNLQNGVTYRYNDKIIDSAMQARLRDICDKIDILFFYPIVYIVDINDPNISTKKKDTPWSKKGSQEYSVDLDSKDKFDLLFVDFDGDSDFNDL